MIVAGLLVCVGGFADQAVFSGCTFGPPERFRFETVVRCTSTATTRIRLLVPTVQADSCVEVRDLRIPKGFPKPEAWVGSEGIDHWHLWNFSLSPRRPMEFRCRAEISTRSVAFDFTRRPTEDELRTIRLEPSASKRFLKLTSSTGEDWGEAAGIVASLLRTVPAVSDSTANTVARARALFLAAVERMNYDPEAEFSGAHAAWDRRKGQCCDYVAVFVALCRQAGIPARAVSGYYFSEGCWRLHVWSEFFIDGVGWAPCDLSLGDAHPAGPLAFFGKTDGRRVAVTRDFDLPIDLGPGTDASLVQQYLMRYRGPSRPEVRFEILGGRLDDAAGRMGDSD